jgi:hypothetical protein
LLYSSVNTDENTSSAYTERITMKKNELKKTKPKGTMISPNKYSTINVCFSSDEKVPQI